MQRDIIINEGLVNDKKNDEHCTKKKIKIKYFETKNIIHTNLLVAFIAISVC